MQTATERMGKAVSIKDLLSMSLQQLPGSFEEIELTPEETEACILEAKVKKYEQVQDRIKKLREEEKRKDEALKIKSTTGFWDYVKKRGDRLVQLQSGDPTDEFLMLASQKHIVKALGYYFMENPEFEKLDTKDFNEQGIPFSLNKGLFLFGPPGVGKSLLMEMFQFNPRICYNIIQCSKLATLVSQDGERIMNTITKEYKNGTLFTPVHFLTPSETAGLCYNDLGTERLDVNYYGNRINVMEQVILNTYDNRVPFWQRFITTNMTAEQLKQTYGVRVTDRIRQAYNIIDMKGESLRR